MDTTDTLDTLVKAQRNLLAFVKNNPTHIGWIKYHPNKGWNIYGEVFRKVN